LKREAAIIGAGPTGILAATQISKNGFNSIIFEEHGIIGKPNHCSGIISVEGFKRLGISPKGEYVQNSIYGGKIFSPNGEFIEFKDKRIRAYVVNRHILDKHLAANAQDHGTEIITGIKVTSILRKDGFYNCIKFNSEKTLFKVVIDAEGAGGKLLREVGLIGEKEGILTGFNTEVSGLDLVSDMVEVWFSDELARGLFAWVIPLSENVARVGLATSKKNGFECLKKFVNKRFSNVEITDVRTGQVCTGKPLRKTAWQGLMAIGDTAGQVKPTTGGGVVIGGLCAKIAGETAVKALEAGDYSLNQLGLYEKEWRNRFQSELQSMFTLRNFLNKLSDDRINRIFQSVKASGLSEVFMKLIREGDMDMQSDIIRKALLNPEIVWLMVNTVGKLAASELLSLLE
jgi:geranylgeranyl reductase family protein